MILFQRLLQAHVKWPVISPPSEKLGVCISLVVRLLIGLLSKILAWFPKRSMLSGPRGPDGPVFLMEFIVPWTCESTAVIA